MGWFPTTLDPGESGWHFDIIILLAVLGSSAVEKHIRAIAASPLSFLPRLIPAPESLLDTDRPTRLPSVQDVTIIGVKSGVQINELNYFANLIHQVESLEEYEFQVWKIDFRGPEITKREIQIKDWSWVTAITLASVLITIGLFIAAGVIHDGVALVGLGSMSAATTMASCCAKWTPKLSQRNANSKVPEGDIVIRTRGGAFVVVRAEEEVIRELYGGVDGCHYAYEGTVYHALLASSMVLLMTSVILFSNCDWKMQIAVGAAYIVLNIGYWLFALLVEPSDIWDLGRRYKYDRPGPSLTQPEEKKDDRENIPSYTRTLSLAIKETGSVNWVMQYGMIPATNVWKEWLNEAEQNLTNPEWKPVTRKDELLQAAAKKADS
ncbi:hypothetical protein BO78DRAFT_449033 [Aspergillus sclerotiicarbonarius CBS 121057]|uniref:Uncharacterized protein n=1 Tax=Aspergillus sclerotiicarbonarius (strain CBS 121057 / IBT 28362) TaxID=1448318 RepID=A0A319E3S0_ASPSB|nr:hypothetical protein BO78DRAFT_449033 [Aspergillus sclerotiicarbonarius CBS 121057]